MKASTISRFNPYQMSEADLRALCVGRQAELQQALKVIEANTATAHSPNEHVLIDGARGAGKSFFMRLLDLNLQDHPKVAFVLLSEELPHVKTPSALLTEIVNRQAGKEILSNIPQWRASDDPWQARLAELLAAHQARHGSKLLVVAIENLDQLLSQAFAGDAAQSRLRKLMEHEPRIMLVASSLYGDVDKYHDQRLFQAFRDISLKPWGQTEHVAYLQARARQAEVAIPTLAEHKIRAYSEFSGGSPRIAVMMADLLLGQENIHDTAHSLFQLIDNLSDYYLDLYDRIKGKASTLFDALLRGGEPCSQTELAKRVGAAQNDITKPFQWLCDYGYLKALPKIPGQRQKLFQVADRLFAQFYHMRYLSLDRKNSVLVSMTNFLSQFYDLRERSQEAYQQQETVRQTPLAASYAEEMKRSGRCEEELGYYPQAIDYHQQTLVLSETLGDKSSQAWSLGQIARYQWQQLADMVVDNLKTDGEAKELAELLKYTLDYLQGELSGDELSGLHPDMATAVRALARNYPKRDS